MRNTLVSNHVYARVGTLLRVSPGLFAPRAGQNFRDEERRRRSQYDRGTRFAELEDSYGPSADQYRVSPGFTGGNFPRASSYQQQVEQMYFSRFQGSC